MPPKHTLHEKPALLSLGGSIRLLPEHTKSYRRRHVLPFVATCMFVLALISQTVAVVSRQSIDPRDLLFGGASAPERPESVSPVRSSYGFAFEYDTVLTQVAASVDGVQEKLTDRELADSKSINEVVVTPLPSRVPTAEAASQLSLKSEIDAAAFATYKNSITEKIDITAITAQYFAPTATELADISEIGRTTEQVGGSLMTKAMYEVTPKFAGAKTVTIVWSAQVDNRPFALTISGLPADSRTAPTIYAHVMQTLTLKTPQQVQGISTLFGDDKPIVIERKYVADLVSPAVVKIYHIVCGSLVYQEEVLSRDVCMTMNGSGFFVSDDGYIATNGHVVVYGAKDMLAQALLADQNLLREFLRGTTMSAGEAAEVMQRADLTASVIAKIYDLPNNQLRLANERQRTLVALGSKPVDLTSEQKVRDIMSGFSDDADIKQAAVVATDYAAKDQFSVVANPDTGFTASDVAILKIDAQNTPFVSRSSEHITQNQQVSLFGFPGDAENSLIDNTTLGVSVTNGTISSIRDAAGGSSKLYQTDADASRGNSGGPAVDEFGNVFGLLTYRFSTGDTTDAAKSYIRDYADLEKLARSQSITFSGDSKTQAAWASGLDNYAKRYYSAALKEFESVKSLYPSHRLVDTYIAQSKQAIDAGRDQSPPSIGLFIAGITGGSITIVALSIVIVRHYGHHRVYRAYHRHRVVAHSH